jgi:hypothetical protein
MEPRPTQVACEGQQGVAELLWSDLSPPEDRGGAWKSHVWRAETGQQGQ